MGILRIHGTIDLEQFWPLGSADADTTKIKLSVDHHSFEYKADEDKKFKPTSAFRDAISKGQGSKPVITTRKADGTQTITVRLQGVDAPELHYKASALKKNKDISDDERALFNAINEERRQKLAESATVALTKHLKTYINSKGLIPALFESYVDQPFEVVDTYGRFIGNIRIGKNHDVNEWLVANGWGIPAFYTSMSLDEIRTFLVAWTKGKTKAGRTGKSLSTDANHFDWKLLYRKPPIEKPFKASEDKGKVIMPKIFRRQTAWMVSKKAGVLAKNTSFQTYLKKAPDQLVLLDELIDQGIHSAPVYNLHDFISADQKILKHAEELVFKEKPGTLVNAKGKKITKW